MGRIGATVRLTAKQGKADELAAVLARVRSEVTKEPGCDLYEIIRARDDPHQFALVEFYRDRDALKAHQRNPAVGPVAAPMGDLVDSMDIQIGDLIDDEARR